jgi:asparagine synthase (glutamine-hydrolysing)
MCGICGVVQVGGNPREVVTPEALAQMTDAMTHRGPNDRGVYQAPGIAIGVRRLSIVDVEGGHQPFFNEDSSVVGAQNGELYNHGEIRRHLRGKGHVFRSRCDTEILPHLYEHSGGTFVAQLHGKFGLVVWDERSRRAVLARDRLGVKPLYWARVDDVVIFASELKSLLASGLIEPSLDPLALDAYLALGYVPAPLTALAGVRKLEPGHHLTIGDGQVIDAAYWTFPRPRPDVPARGLAEYAEELLSLLRESVRMRLMSDVPLGAMLSGGLDSSLIVALMAEMSSHPVKTFAIAFREDGDRNELPHARRVAEFFGCEHHELELSLSDADVDLDTLVWHLDEPVAELSSLGFHALSALAAQHVTVALSGQGADELFGGYRKHLAARLVGLTPGARLVGPLMGAAAARGPEAAQRFARAVTARNSVDRLLAMSASIDASARHRLYRGAMRRSGIDGARGAIHRLANGVAGSPLSTTLYLDAQLALVDNMLHYFDRMSMASSLEVRVPYLDHVLVEWAATVPDAMKVGVRRTKRVLRAAARGHVPDDIIDRRKVAFFRRSAGSWLAAQIAGPVGDRLLDPQARYGEVVDRSAIAKRVEVFRAGDPRDAQLLLSLLVLEFWLDRFNVRTSSEAAPELVSAC